MKKSKRYIKKQNNKPLINKKVLAKVIRESNICKHAIKELKLAGYGNGEGGPNDWIYQQVIEAIAVFASHGNSGGSAPFSRYNFDTKEWTDNKNPICWHGGLFEYKDNTMEEIY